MVGGTTERDATCDADREIESIRSAIDMGVTCIDTAELYSAGYAEELVGRAIKKYDRNSLQIISKVAANNLNYDNVLRAAEGSLRRLGVEYLDLYLIHQPNPKIPLLETMKAMKELLRSGLIKNIGISNAKVQTLENAQSSIDEPIVLNQVHYNLIYREPERCGLLEYCQKHKVLLMAWRPVQKGELSNQVPQLLLDLAKKYDRTPAQIAINWLVCQESVITLAGMKDRKHLQENLGALDWTMDSSDIELLRNQYPGQQPTSDRVPLI